MAVDVSDKKWRGKESLDNSTLLDNCGQDVRNEIAYEDGTWSRGSLYCKLQRSGHPANFHPIFTTRIVLFSKPIASINLERLDHQVELISVLEKTSGQEFHLFRPSAAISAVSFKESEIEDWPADFQLEPWHDPRGRMFIKPAINQKKIPNDLKIFRLKDWPGVSNIVVLESAKHVLESYDNVKQGISFIELNVVN